MTTFSLFVLVFLIGAAGACVEVQLRNCEDVFHPEMLELQTKMAAANNTLDKNREIRNICSGVRQFLRCMEWAGVRECGQVTENHFVATLRKYDRYPYSCRVAHEYIRKLTPAPRPQKEEGDNQSGIYIGSGVGGGLLVFLVVVCVLWWCCCGGD